MHTLHTRFLRHRHHQSLRFLLRIPTNVHGLVTNTGRLDKGRNHDETCHDRRVGRFSVRRGRSPVCFAFFDSAGLVSRVYHHVRVAEPIGLVFLFATGETDVTRHVRPRGCDAQTRGSAARVHPRTTDSGPKTNYKNVIYHYRRLYIPCLFYTL